MKKWLWLIPAAILLLVGYFVIETPFEDKRCANPIGEGVTALEFVLADGSASVRLTDPEAIDKLRRAYRWTNYHMYCCLEPDEVFARVHMIGSPTEPIKIYNSWDVPSFNLEFRLLLRKYCDELMEE